MKTSIEFLPSNKQQKPHAIVQVIPPYSEVAVIILLDSYAMKSTAIYVMNL